MTAVVLLPKIRVIENTIIKTISYAVMGVIIFTWVGVSYDIWLINPDKLNAATLVTPYFPQIFPVFILAVALAIAVLITYIDKENYAYIFAGTAFAALLPDVLTYVAYGRFDLILLGLVLWAIIPVVWVYMWKDHVLEKTSFKDTVLISLKAALVTYPVYVLTALVAVFGKSGRGIDLGILTKLGDNIVLLIGFLLGVLWLYLLFSVIIVTVMFVAHDLLLHMLGMKRVVNKKGIQYVKDEPEKPEPKPAQKLDPYSGLLNEMVIFNKYMDRVDRLNAASTIARFKNEYQTLSVKYSEGSRADVEQMIKLVEENFMKRY